MIAPILARCVLVPLLQILETSTVDTVAFSYMATRAKPTLPRVSVILPTLNEEQTIKETVRSISDQTYRDFEVIVIDDGSTDKTVDIVQELSDRLPTLQIIEREDTRGLASALNRGIEEAGGEYLARHDADDESLPNRFEQQVSYLDENPDTDVVGTGAYHIEENGSRRNRRRVLEDPPAEAFREGNPIIHGSIMMRTDAAESVGGYDEMFPTSEDIDLWIRLSQEHGLGNIDEPLYLLRLSHDSAYAGDMYTAKLYARYAAIRAFDDRLPEGYDEIVAEYGEEAIEDVLLDEELVEIKATTSYEVLRWGKRSESREYALSVLSVQPFHVIALLSFVLSFFPHRFVLVLVNLYRMKLNREIKRANEMK